jgi:uncharacterized protein YjbI with pentapeptide repeats
MNHVAFLGVNLSGAKMTGLQGEFLLLEKVNLSSADLSWSNLNYVFIVSGDIKGANLEGVICDDFTLQYLSQLSTEYVLMDEDLRSKIRSHAGFNASRKAC